MKGTVHKYKDNVNTDEIIPARYLNDSTPAALAAHCMEDIDKSFVGSVKPGDIITFRSIDPANYGEVVTHKVQELTSYEGKDAYVTYGTANESADSYPALKEKVIGQYRFRLPKAGALFDYLKSPAGYFVLLFLPFFLLMLSQGIRFFRLFKQYKERQGPRPQGEETPPASIE